MPAGHLLSLEDFAACFLAPVRDVTGCAEAVVDVWPYVDRLDRGALGLPGINEVRRLLLLALR